MLDFSHVNDMRIPQGGSTIGVRRILDSLGRVVWLKLTGIYCPFYIQNTGNQTANVYIQRNYIDSSIIVDIEVSDNGRYWTSLGNTGNNLTLSIPAGKKKYLRATGRWANSNYYNYITGDTGSGISFSVGGNIMSLLYGSGFVGDEQDLKKAYTFAYLFYNWSTLKDASKLLLPVNELNYGHCYEGMFYKCVGLTGAPELPATTLGEYCYSNMFHYCEKLEKAPVLPAVNLAKYCYMRMFSDCVALKEVTCNAYFQSNHDYTTNWMYDVATSGTFYKNSSMSFWTTDVNGIPSGWTVVDL